RLLESSFGIAVGDTEELAPGERADVSWISDESPDQKRRIKRPGAGSSKLEGEFRRYKRSDMATGQRSGVIQHLRRAMLLRDGAGLTDQQLLKDYIRRRDEAAPADLVQRHGLMVWGVCRRVLSKYHDAEDAFQATFLVLVRR